MTIRAVIFDIYGTVLKVGPPPDGAEELWQALFSRMLGSTPPVTRAQFTISATQIIARLHADARMRGIQWPEIQWPTVVKQVLPGVAQLPGREFDEFLLNQMQFGRTLKLAEGAAECLRALNREGRLLGIASNSQAYTLHELEAALSGTGLSLAMFDPGLRFWSFEHGFSKPDPHVFRMLSARLEARGIRPEETLMVGDRPDNDIDPARAQGWQSWLLTGGPGKAGQTGGNWQDLNAWLTRATESGQ